MRKETKILKRAKPLQSGDAKLKGLFNTVSQLPNPGYPGFGIFFKKSQSRSSDGQVFLFDFIAFLY